MSSSDWYNTNGTSSSGNGLYRVYTEETSKERIEQYFQKYYLNEPVKEKEIKDKIEDSKTFEKIAESFHKRIEQMQEELFARGSIESPCDLSEVEIKEEEKESEPEDLVYFDPKDLDI